ncbi:MAG: threonine--tRNA ligase [Candidatus Taylorbacteria bacterium]
MKSTENLPKLRHSLAHLLAAAVLELYPDALNTIGPAIDNGFYYDFEFSAPISDKNLKKIENKMREILKHWDVFEHIDASVKEAQTIFANNPYKSELIEEINAKGEKITLYYSGPKKSLPSLSDLKANTLHLTPNTFLDLCRGGHVEDIEELKKSAWKLSHIAGAYWRGDEKNKMLTRIYGLAFESKEELEAYEKQTEEAKKRDHKKLGRELGLFIFSDLVGPGLPIYTFKGAAVRREIINFSNELQKEIGYQEVHTPNMNKAELFKVSGHYEKFREDMFKVSSQYTKEEYFLKPMNCPQHTQIFSSENRSYRDLPIRISDFANLYRDEKPGQLSGLTRLRSFSQDDGHSFCREDQIKEEFTSVLGAIQKALKVYGMSYKIRLSLWDETKREKYLGEPAVWEKSQKILEEILKERGVDYFVGIGEAAIYGPKMDVITTDSIGREWQISTIQLDFIMPERFGLKYTDKDGKEKTPVMIHRALVGSPERFLGILIEHYAGNFPLWLSPVQVKIIPVRENHNTYAEEVYGELRKNNIRVEIDIDDENLGKKVRKAKVEKIPYFIIIGDKDLEARKVTLESRDHGNLGQLDSNEVLVKLQKEIEEKK